MDFIGLLIFLYIIFRSASDKKKGKQRNAPRRRADQEYGAPSQEAELGDILGEFFGFEGYNSDSDDRTIVAEEQVKRIEKPTRETQTDLNRREEHVEVKREQVIYTPVQPVKPKAMVKPVLPKAQGPLLKGVDIKQAFIWSEILQKPMALRRRNIS